MAGTLILPQDYCWLPAGWVYDNVLERMAAILWPRNHALAARLLESRTEVNGGYLNLENTDPEALRLLLDAADEAYHQFEAAGPSSFHQPEFYPGFMRRLAELRQMLHLIALSE